jgi:hypothetical protein
MLWRDEPPAILGLAQQGGETRSGIKAWPAQPINRAIAADQSCRFAVAD